MFEIKIPTGIIDIPVNGKRTIHINPTDPGVVYNIAAMLDKIQFLSDECEKKVGKLSGDEKGKSFDRYRERDEKIVEAIDAVFGDGFWNEAFEYVRPTAMTGDGLFVVEALAYSVLDCMDDGVMSNLEKRNARIEKYTSKWEKRGRVLNTAGNG